MRRRKWGNIFDGLGDNSNYMFRQGNYGSDYSQPTGGGNIYNQIQPVVNNQTMPVLTPQVNTNNVSQNNINNQNQQQGNNFGSIAGAAGTIATHIGEVVNRFNVPDYNQQLSDVQGVNTKYGLNAVAQNNNSIDSQTQGFWGNFIGDNIKGASAGMSIGGPWGALIGAGIAGTAGAIGTLFGNKRKEDAAKRAAAEYSNNINNQNTLINMNQAASLRRNSYAYGGLFSNGVNEFPNYSGTHESNPLGGIPVGIGDNGQPNLVEGGETKWNDYIFSDRMSLDNGTDLFLLPSSLQGNKFSDASLKVSNESNERELDPISNLTKNTMLARLAMMQETMRQDPNNLFAEGGKLTKLQGLIDNPATKQLIPGGKATNDFIKHSDTDVDPFELRVGIKVEMEHTDDPKKAREIALDHLIEKPDYYTRLYGTGIADESITDEEKEEISRRYAELQATDPESLTMEGEMSEGDSQEGMMQTDQPDQGNEMGIFAKGGSINIKPSKRGTFKAQASKMGLGVQEAASKILNAPEGKYSPAMRKKANFAKNFAHAYGGKMYPDGGILGVNPFNQYSNDPIIYPYSNANNYRSLLAANNIISNPGQQIQIEPINIRAGANRNILSVNPFNEYNNDPIIYPHSNISNYRPLSSKNNIISNTGLQTQVGYIDPNVIIDNNEEELISEKSNTNDNVNTNNDRSILSINPFDRYVKDSVSNINNYRPLLANNNIIPNAGLQTQIEPVDLSSIIGNNRTGSTSKKSTVKRDPMTGPNGNKLIPLQSKGIQPLQSNRQNAIPLMPTSQQTAMAGIDPNLSPNNYYDEWLRYAPVATNAGLAISSIFDRPEVIDYDRVNPGVITGNMTPDVIDNEYVANQMRQQGAATNRDILNVAGGNRAIASALMLNANAGSQSAIASALMQGRMYNNQQRQMATQFNTDVERQNIANDLAAQQYNSQARLSVDDMNARNRAARTNAINHYLSLMGSNLGQIGTENRWKNIAPILSQGYNDRGLYQYKCGGKMRRKK